MKVRIPFMKKPRCGQWTGTVGGRYQCRLDEGHNGLHEYIVYPSDLAPPPQPMTPEDPMITEARQKRTSADMQRIKFVAEVEKWDELIRFLEEHRQAPRLFRALVANGIAVPATQTRGGQS